MWAKLMENDFQIQPDKTVSVSTISASIVAVAEVVAKYIDKADPNAQKVQMAARYAETFFDGKDMARIRDELQSRPALVAAVKAQDFDAAVASIGPVDGSTDTTLLVTAVFAVSSKMSEEDKETMWYELATWCELVSSPQPGF
jgi:hypothetical protein